MIVFGCIAITLNIMSAFIAQEIINLQRFDNQLYHAHFLVDSCSY